MKEENDRKLEEENEIRMREEEERIEREEDERRVWLENDRRRCEEEEMERIRQEELNAASHFLEQQEIGKFLLHTLCLIYIIKVVNTFFFICNSNKSVSKIWPCMSKYKQII